MHTSSIALEGALVEVVASSQDGLQEVDKALAGTHLLAANLQHLQLLPHLPPQTVRCQSDVRNTMPKTDCCRCNTAGCCSQKRQKACWVNLMLKVTHLCSAAAYLATQYRKPETASFQLSRQVIQSGGWTSTWAAAQRVSEQNGVIAGGITNECSSTHSPLAAGP